MQIITLTTDLGVKDHYSAILKGTFLSLCPGVQIVEISHEIKPYDIVQAAFVLKNSFFYFPKGTLHIVTVNNSPEKLSFIVFEQQGHFFVGPDNGIFYLMFNEISAARRIDYEPESLFPLKDILGKVVAHLGQGHPLSSIGVAAQNLVQRIVLQPVISPSQIRGVVIYVDHYENVTINITRELFERIRNGRKFALFFKRNDPITRLCRYYNEVPVGEPLCLFNSAGYLEIAINMGKASSLLGLKHDDVVQIDFF